MHCKICPFSNKKKNLQEPTPQFLRVPIHLPWLGTPSSVLGFVNQTLLTPGVVIWRQTVPVSLHSRVSSLFTPWQSIFPASPCALTVFTYVKAGGVTCTVCTHIELLDILKNMRDGILGHTQQSPVIQGISSETPQGRIFRGTPDEHPTTNHRACCASRCGTTIRSRSQSRRKFPILFTICWHIKSYV